MGRIWAIIWLAAAGCGVWLMTAAYRDGKQNFPPESKRQILFVAQEPGAKAQEAAPVAVYFLPADENVDVMANSLGGAQSSLGKSFLRNHQEKIILFPDFEKRFSADILESGTLPKAGSKEVLADPLVAHHDRLTAGNAELRVVGTLKLADSFGQDAYYAADNPDLRQAIDANGEQWSNGFIISLEDLKKIEDLKTQFPHSQFMTVTGSQRLDQNSYYNYAGGMFLLLLGGSGLIIQCYLFAAGRITNAWLGPPLVEIGRHWKLFCLLHAAYFGIFIAGVLLIYEAPLVQDFLLTILKGQIESESGVLGVAGLAYGTKNIALAAVTTLVINFLAGSLLMITAPSVVVPGIGVVTTVLRATVWGIAPAPAHIFLAGSMIFHSGTLLLEGEGYILAAFFALLIPIYLFSPRTGENVGTRYVRALVMNIKGNLLVFIVLAVAATYEAIEVILQM